MNRHLVSIQILAMVLLLLGVSGDVGAQMPDVRQMSGLPIPSADVPAGTVVVRVIRGELTNNIPGLPVELHVGDRVLTARTDGDGRATFAGLASGTHAHAVAVVDGERLESSHLDIEGPAGLRVMLVAGSGAGTAPAGGGTPGELMLGGQSQIQFELDDDQLQVFYMLEIVNPGSAPAEPGKDLVLVLPDEAQSPAMLEGSSPQAQLRDKTVAFIGPFRPGTTPVQLAFVLGRGRAARTLSQAFPLPWDRVQVTAPQVAALALTSPQFAGQAAQASPTMPFLMASGPALPAGQPLNLTLTGLPVRSHVGRWIALCGGVLLLLWGGVAVARTLRTSPDAARDTALETQRMRLLAELERLERQRLKKPEETRLVARRADIVAQLERIYGELDRSPDMPTVA